MNNPIQIILLFWVTLALLALALKPKLLLPIFIGTLPLEALVESDIYSLPKILGALTLIGFIVITIREKRTIVYDKPLILMLVFVGWGGLSYFWSVNPDLSLFRLTTLVQLLILYFLLINQARDIRVVDTIMKFLFLGGLIYASFGLSDLLLGTGLAEGQRLASIAKNPNWYFTISICLFPACYWLLLTQKNKGIKILVYITVLTLIITSIFTESRGGLISLAIFALTYFMLGKNKVSWLLLVLVFVLLFVQIVPSTYLERFLTVGRDPNDRLTYLWPAGLEAIGENPFLGYGLGTNRQVVPKFIWWRPTYEYQISVHSALLAVGIELGIPGLLFYLLFAAIPTVRLYRFTRRTSVGETTSLVSNVGKVLLCVMMAYLATWIKGGGVEYQKFLWVILGLETCLMSLLNKRLSEEISQPVKISIPVRNVQ